MSNLLETKKKLRKEFRQRRDIFVRGLDAATRNLAFRRPPSPLIRLIEQKQTIALYSATGSEAPTARLTEYLIESGKTVAFPVVLGTAPLEFRSVSNIDLLEAGYQNIPEPPANCPVVKPDIIVAPLVAFDRSMGRLGQGGGHYDRTFEEYPDALRIGLAWSVQEADLVPTASHDARLQIIVTECEIIQIDRMTS